MTRLMFLKFELSLDMEKLFLRSVVGSVRRVEMKLLKYCESYASRLR